MSENCKFPMCKRHPEANGYCIGHKIYAGATVAKETAVIKKDKQKQKPIKKKSDKLSAELRIYNMLAKDFLKDHPKCECGRPDCNRISQEVHHAAGRGKNLNRVEFFIALSSECHRWVHDHHAKAVELGLFISKFKPIAIAERDEDLKATIVNPANVKV